MLKREDIRIRDPFILTDTENGCYYMYGTTDLYPDSMVSYDRFSVYKSTDLENFSEPKVIFDGSKINFWADICFWAAEVHKYKGKYYLFGTCIKEGKNRGTQIFVCDTPDGTFVPLTEFPVTPAEWMCLDGTLFIDDGVPYIIFCHEWTQITIGDISAMPLTDDLTKPAGEPFTLFKANDNPNVVELHSKGSGIYYTDGPFVYREDGKIKIMWSSSVGEGDYGVLIAESDSLHGSWTHSGRQFELNAGHSMLFHTLDGTRMISMHQNHCPDEHPVFLKF